MSESAFHEKLPFELPVTDDVRRLIAGARDQPTRLDHEYVGTEHVVLALAQQVEANTPLRALGIDPGHVDVTISGIIQRG